MNLLKKNVRNSFQKTSAKFVNLMSGTLSGDAMRVVILTLEV